MAWKTSSAMDEKIRFVFSYERDEEPMAHTVESNRVWCADFLGWPFGGSSWVLGRSGSRPLIRSRTGATSGCIAH